MPKKILKRVPSFSAFETWGDRVPVGNAYDRKKAQKTSLDSSSFSTRPNADEAETWDQGQLALITAETDTSGETWKQFFIRALLIYSGTQPGWARVVRRVQISSPILAFPLIIIDSCMRGVGQVLVLNNAALGLIIIAALLIDNLWVAICSIFGLLATTMFGVAIGANTSLVLNGVLSVNGYLVGAAAGYFLEAKWEASVLGAITIMSAYSIIIEISLGNVFVPSWRVYPLGLTFAFTSGAFFYAIFILDVYEFSFYYGEGMFPYQYYTDRELDFWFLFRCLFIGIGGIFFLTKWET